jgi:integrase
MEWELLIRTALCTGMRRGELLNTIWRDIDFDAATVEAAPNFDGEHTWEWHVKDADRRTLALTEDVLTLLAERQARAPEGCPYVFVPMSRYSHIHKLRNDGKWTVEEGRGPVNNFTRQFNTIQMMASVEHREFHDLRRTCLTNWLAGGLSEFEVAYLAGHAKFETTGRFYLAVRRDFVNHARAVSENVSKSHFVAHP